MTRFIDFDAARAERKREPVVVRIYGRDWELHTGLPASVMLDVIEAHADGSEEISDKQAIVMLRQLVPEDVLSEWFKLGLTIDELMELVPLLMRAYSGGKREDEAGEAAAPSLTPESSSVSTGGSSRPTSSASIAAISTPDSKTA